jgi:hypothetical protein
MKMPNFIGSILHKPQEHKEVYLSLYLDVHTIAVSFWSLGSHGHPEILAIEHADDIVDTWEAKGESIDRLVGILEEKTKITDVTKVILGLPNAYLGVNGDIRKEVRKEIKELTHILELEPIGFVPLSQAMMYKLKKDEGIPPSIILLGISDETIAVSLYKIGVLAGVRDIDKKEDVAIGVEEGLKSFTDLEILPARILLYGSDQSVLEDVKSELLRHQWPPSVNFLHFPKIESATDTFIIDAVSLAGASELGHTVELETDKKETVSEDIVEEKKSMEEEVEPELEEKIEEELEHQKKVTEEVVQAQEIIQEDFATDKDQMSEENVVMVDAESLGFKKDVDVLEEKAQKAKVQEEIEEEVDETGGRTSFALPKIDFSRVINFIKGIPSRFEGSGAKLIPVAILSIFLVVIGILYWLLPHAIVTILEIPKPIEASETITIDPTATVVDAQNKIIPGRKREKSISGEKTVAVNGKKNVGESARGTVTIYNKALSTKSFKKGTVIITGNLHFTLDNDIDIASASESIGSITFGKGDVSVTAAAIGTQSNITSGNEFSFQNISSGVASARNDSAFTGGTSREVTVVTRADYDAFIKTMSEELVVKAKEEFSTSLEGNDKLIDGTIKTAVTEKVFGQEIDQEAKELQGKLALTVTGTAYSETDIRALLTTISSDTLPSGYAILDTKTIITVTNIIIKKDGKITAKAQMSAVAFPVIDTASIQSSLAGKSIKDAEAYLRNLMGVAGAEVSFRFSPTRDRLPLNKNNISVSISLQQ